MKLEFSDYKDYNGISTCTVSHRGRNYEGTAKLHPEDSGSKYFGCGLAEIRAEIKALKFERRIKRLKCEECRKFLKACSQYKNFDKESSTAKAMYRQLNQRIKEVNKITDEINKREFDLLMKIRSRDAILSKIDKKNNKNS